MQIRVELNKNLTLMYSLLNVFDQAVGDPETQPLRLKVKYHFKGYKGRKPDAKDYVHEHKLVIWALTVGEPPEFIPKKIDLDPELDWHIEKGASIKPCLVEFYNTTDFEKFYSSIKPELNKYKKAVETILKDIDVNKLLMDTWGLEHDTKMIVIPNPFTWGSFGPQIGDINYQVIGLLGEEDRDSILRTIIHEGSHPLANFILKSYREKIREKSSLLKVVMKHPKYPSDYNSWETCFEEHLIRAVQLGKINPKLFKTYDVLKELEKQENNRGMVLIKTFYDELMNSDSVGEAIPRIISKL